MTTPNFVFDATTRRSLRLTEADVDAVLGPDLAREAVERALICHQRGRYVQPLKPYVRPGGRRDEYRRGRAISMSAYLGEPFHVLGTKWITGFPINVERGLPRASATIVLNSADDGSRIALIDGATLSARRTGAVAAIGVKYLAMPGPMNVALLGAGPIAQASVEALLNLGPGRAPTSIRIYDPRPDRVDALIFGFERAGADVRMTRVESTRAAVEDASVVIAATTGARSTIEDAWIAPGTLVVALSLDDPTPQLFLGCKVVVDDFRQCCRERKLIHRLTLARRFGRDQVHATLGQVVSGDHPGRQSEADRILVNAMGMAILDVAAAHSAYMAAVTMGIGMLEPEPAPRDEVPPEFLFQPRVGVPARP